MNNATTLSQQSRATGAIVDPITAEIIRYGLSAIADQIEKNIMRTAFTQLIYEYKDFSVGIVDFDGAIIAQGKGSPPLFISNALSAAVRDGLQFHGLDGLSNGDVFLNNYSGAMGQHLNNVVMYTPICHNREVFGFMCILMHWMDVGGGVSGSCFDTKTTEIFQEGIQYRCVKLCSKGEPVDDAYRMIEYNTRFPDQVLGDVSAQLAGCLKGRDLALELLHKYGHDIVRGAVELMWSNSESVARAAILQIPDGEYRANSFLDNNGVDMDTPVQLNVIVRVTGSEIEVDFSDIADQQGGPINSGFAGGAMCAARMACKYLFTPGEPANEGAFRPLKVTIPEGKLLNARPTAPMGGSGFALPSVVDTIFRALAEAMPDRVSAGHHATYGTHAFQGVSPLNGEQFQHLESSIGGWGATARTDGASAFRTLVAGDMFDTSAEFMEANYPIRVHSARLRPDSGGAGTFRGGLGTAKVFEILAPCSMIVYFERTKCPPWGLRGGKEGLPGYVELVRKGRAPQRILKGNGIALEPGDVIHVIAGGGGGFGPPQARDIDRVRADVAHGFVSVAHALADYSVQPSMIARLDRDYNATRASSTRKLSKRSR